MRTNNRLGLALICFCSLFACSDSKTGSETHQYVQQMTDSFRLYFQKQRFISAVEARKRWGHATFRPEEFKKGDWRIRSTMVADVIEKKVYQNKQIETVQNDLGAHDGYFWDDHVPAYIVEDGQVTGNDYYELVFLFDQGGRVTEVLIHQQSPNRKAPFFQRKGQ